MAYFLRSIPPDYSLPSRVTLSHTLVPALAKEIVASILADLQSAEFVSIATDGWSTASAEQVIAITVHYVNKNFQLMSRTIAIESLEDQTAKGINEMCKKILNVEKIKIVAFKPVNL